MPLGRAVPLHPLWVELRLPALFRPGRQDFIRAACCRLSSRIGRAVLRGLHDLKCFVPMNSYTYFLVKTRVDAIRRLGWATQGLDLFKLQRAVQVAGGPTGRIQAADLRA